MKILHVITGLGKAAGTSTFCGEVCNQLAARGHDVTIAVCNPAAPDIYLLDKKVKLVSIESVLHSPTLHSNYDIIHIHGLWSPILHRVSNWTHMHNIPVVWSTHGMTAPWAMKHKWWKKFLPWCLYQKRDLKRAAAIHCTTELEVDWNKKLGFKNCFVAPLGTRLPDLSSTPTPHAYTSTLKTLLFVGRIYPVKALDRLIEAFARVDESVRRNWTLRLVGPDQAGHMAELMSLCDRLGIPYSTPEQESTIHCMTSDYNSAIQFAGPKFGQELDAEYASCDCLALVSHTENFGATVVDAMAHGKPVITSTKTPWKVVADNKCGWWVDNDVVSLSAALREVCGEEGLRAPRADAPSGDLTVGGYLQGMGKRGRELVRERYTWSAVCDKMVRGYEGVLK